MAEATIKRNGCIDLDPRWPDINGEPRGPVLCVSYPNCQCGRDDLKLAADQLRRSKDKSHG